MTMEPELGQMCFGNPTGEFGTDDAVDALVDYILSDIERVFWNNNQRQWDRMEDPGIKGMEFRKYWWGDEEDPEAAKPNLKFDFSPQEIRWYKHPGRGQSCSLKWGAQQWHDWLNKAIEVVRNSDKRF